MFRLRTILSSASLALAATTAPAAAPPAAAPTLAPLAQAHTFAQVRQGSRVHTLLALEMGAGKLTAIDLSAASGSYSPDAFDVINRFDAAALDRLARQAQGAVSHPLEHLLGVGPRGLAHIAAGTNYPAHGKEVGMHEAFLFPKLSAAGAPRARVAAVPGALLDYEVEVCARFDRELRSGADFDAARKGFFLCGDFSDRATWCATSTWPIPPPATASPTPRAGLTASRPAPCWWCRATGRPSCGASPSRPTSTAASASTPGPAT
ncbi:hypothetical protein [Massilia timonae]|uniref:hypothetical protein n=1 Tax=Massilia timonae TaxID=47229 RepID=UPI000EB8C107|nr:hypothetical protein [Massilia timonae]HAK92344.1 hypothetical protein [Massilia timonae]